jgi:Flp pilus assembly protein TadG
MMMSSRRRRVAQGGSVMLEFALAFMMLFGFFAGIFQFGYTFYAYNTLVSAVRQGARYAAGRPRDAGFQTAVENQVVYGNPSPPAGAKPMLNGLTTGNVAVRFTPAEVTVSITNFQINAVFSTVTLSGRPKITYPVF